LESVERSLQKNLLSSATALSIVTSERDSAIALVSRWEAEKENLASRAKENSDALQNLREQATRDRREIEETRQFYASELKSAQAEMARSKVVWEDRIRCAHQSATKAEIERDCALRDLQEEQARFSRELQHPEMTSQLIHNESVDQREINSEVVCIICIFLL
jgi:hypothetical protein